MPPRYTLALDIGKNNHVACVYDTATGQLSQPLNVPVTAEGFARLKAMLQRYSKSPADFLVGYEATGHYAETMVRDLRTEGYQLVRLNPAAVAAFRRGLGRRAKSDVFDSEALARQLAIGNYRADPAPSPTQQVLQRLTHLRVDLVKEQTQWVNRLRGLLDRLCPELPKILGDMTSPTTLAVLSAYPGRQRLAQAAAAELTQVVRQVSRGQRGSDYVAKLQAAARQSVGVNDRWLDTEVKLVVNQLTSVVSGLRDLDKEIAQVTNEYLAELSNALGFAKPLTIKDFPWGSYVAVGSLLAEIGDVRRYPSLKHLLSYLGWCPYQRQSGEYEMAHPPMSHQGNRHARRMVWLMAIGAIGSVPEYQAYFARRVAEGKSKMKTLVAVGRKLLSVLYAILRTGVPYDPQRYLQFGEAKNKNPKN